MPAAMTDTTIEHRALTDFAARLLGAAGMAADKAAVQAEIVVEGDLIGHATHGVAQLPWYVDALASGEMAGDGEPEIIADRGASFAWNGRHLPGAWLLRGALDLACERVATHGVVSGALSNCHHTCALAAYLPRVTTRGHIALLNTSNPAAGRMAPFGGTRALLTPNPLAAGFPTGGDPVMIDISSSITTTTMTQTLAREGRRFPDRWALTAAGEPTDDPREVTERGGSLLPLGGADMGHKGYGLALLVELLSQGLAGFGRADRPAQLSQGVFLQVIDPDAFAGRDAFLRQADFLAAACRANPPAPGVDAVRLPGDNAMRKRRRALADGVPVAAATRARLGELAKRLGVAAPAGLDG